MTRPPRDNPGVIVFPPLLFGGALLAGLALHALFPWRPIPGPVAQPVGAILMVLGLWVGGWGERTMKRAGTNVRPSLPALVLVTAGPFAYSRNPLYLSVIALYAGITLVVNAVWPFLLLVPAVLVAHFGIVRREERYLDAKFGDAYRGYAARVRRWI